MTAASELKRWTLGKREVLPIVQGGMGVGISAHRLAGAVARLGAVGTISSVDLRHHHPDLMARAKNCTDRDELDRLNLIALDREVRMALSTAAGRGAVAVNVMKAVSAHAQYVRQSCESGAHAIVMGAGLPLDLPEMTRDFPDAALVPILSDVRGIAIVLKKWLRKKRLPDAIVIEHPRYAGGHLGATRPEEIGDPRFDFEPVLEGVFGLFRELGIERERIPLIPAGGINTHEKVRALLALGASAVQIGTPFAVTEECDAHPDFKKVLAEARPEDIVTFTSVAGLPARAVLTPWLKNYLRREKALQSHAKADPRRCVPGLNCLTVCGLRDGIAAIGQFCIDTRLAFAMNGDVKKGLFFRGSESVPFGSAIRPVADLLDYLLTGRQPGRAAERTSVGVPHCRDVEDEEASLATQCVALESGTLPAMPAAPRHLQRPRLLLINPRFPESFWSFRWAIDVLPGKRAVNPPLGLATLAALCPPHWDVTIVDENVEPMPLEPAADIIGVCGMGAQFARQKELLAYYRKAGYRVVAGGSYASLCPERFEGLADTVVAGEAEYIWREFCDDFEQGAARQLYHENGTVALADSPVPRFDLLKLEKYSTATLQFSRGCPYLCEFCDIIVMFGRKPRYKGVDQVGRELDALRQLGQRNVFFVDDNLIGHRAAAKGLLQYLAEYQRRHDYEFRFGTEASLNLAQDSELMRLFREAHFTWVFIGIESSDPETLRQTRKTQNLHEDVLTSVRRIYAHGIDILAGFIVGFDNDTLKTFERQYRFIVESGVQAAMVGLLTALPKTPLHARLEKEGRLRPAADATDNTRPATNLVPRLMSYESMIGAYEAMYRQLVTDRVIAERIRNKLKYMPAPLYSGEYSSSQRLAIVLRLLGRGILAGGVPRTWHFLRTLVIASPRQLPVLLVDWIAGLSMQNYVRRRFARQAGGSAAISRLCAKIQRIGAAHLGEARITFSPGSAVAPNLLIRLRGGTCLQFFARAARHIERLLGKTQATITLHIDELRKHEVPHLNRLLARLARHGDRISIVLGERMRGLVPIDSSVFNLVLEESAP
jgi:NAD(P)H-dependent flavin oxidoreductase YrpB (nitropropane dioxygenase family)/radical SAM superfamily enzyme YgiQ (UPF0313 family)